jgi:hypothetical protein
MGRYILFAILMFSLIGCSEMPRRIDTSQSTAIGTSLTYEYKNQTATNYFKNAYDKASDKKKERNQILFELLGIVDDEFSEFERQLRSDRAYKDVVVKILSLALTGVASLSGESAANTLAAIDTGLKGANEAVDRSAFRDHAPELLINRMRANRALGNP